MAFKVKIKNIGKLEDAEVSIGQFTVFAGPNNTGKSFVSKLLYSLFNAMNANHVETHLQNLVEPVYHDLTTIRLFIEEHSDKAIISWRSSLENEIKKLATLINGTSIEEFYNKEMPLKDIIPDLISQLKKIEQIATDIPQFLEKKLSQPYMTGLINSLIALKNELSQIDTKNFIIAGIGHELSQNLIQNFQVPIVSDLIRKEGTPSEVVVEDSGKFALLDEGVRFEIDGSWVKQLQQYSRVIYLESSVYWKMKIALANIRDWEYAQQRYGDNRVILSGVPEYYHDLARALKYEYTGAMAFPDVYAKLTGKNVMGGKIAISETGNLSFQENGRNFSLPVTAMGIANLGILALLIERKVLDKGTFLFIDEPEAHLHPAWQVIMAETLFELAKAGVNVVIATHSVDILKWLEVRVKKNPDDEQLIALNQFPVKSGNTEEDFETKMGKIMYELTRPFSDLYIEGI